MLTGGDVARAHQSEASSGLLCLGTVLGPFRLASHTSVGLRAKPREQRESEARDRSNSKNLPDCPGLAHQETLPFGRLSWGGENLLKGRCSPRRGFGRRKKRSHRRPRKIRPFWSHCNTLETNGLYRSCCVIGVDFGPREEL